jgi:hypothetical protein
VRYFCISSLLCGIHSGNNRFIRSFLGIFAASHTSTVVSNVFSFNSVESFVVSGISPFDSLELSVVSCDSQELLVDSSEFFFFFSLSEFFLSLFFSFFLSFSESLVNKSSNPLFFHFFKILSISSFFIAFFKSL